MIDCLWFEHDFQQGSTREAGFNIKNVNNGYKHQFMIAENIFYYISFQDCFSDVYLKPFLFLKNATATLLCIS